MKIQRFFGRLFEMFCLICFALSLLGRTEYFFVGALLGFLGMVVLDQSYWEESEQLEELKSQHNENQ